MKKKSIYLDYAATTPLDKRVYLAMQPYFNQVYGNSSSVHHFGSQMNRALDNARKTLANEIGAKPAEIIFTSSATEANNLALKGFAQANRQRGNHLILSSIEHPSIYETAKYLETKGFEISIIKVDAHGVLDLDQLRNALRNETVLVSVMYVNNELGSIQPLADIGKLCRDNGICFHTDAAQGFGRFNLDSSDILADMIGASSHKIYGPLGSGFLYVKSGIAMEPQQHGGAQEGGLRASTVNVPAAVGFAEALKVCVEGRNQEYLRLKNLKLDFLNGLQTQLSDLVVNGNPEVDSPHILNLSFPGCDAEILMMQLDQKGIAVSTGSACASGNIKESRVLKSIKLAKRFRTSAIRFSFGRFTKRDELEYVAGILPDLVRRVRKIS